MKIPAYLVNKVYSQSQTCSLLGISRPTLRKLVQEGKLPAFRETLTSRLYIQKAVVDSIVAKYTSERNKCHLSNE